MEGNGYSRKRMVLLIDDEEHFCYFVKANLERTGQFVVLIATDGLHGIRLAQINRPDIILLDINMPGLDGQATAERILETENIHNIPLIFISALVTKNEVSARGGMIAGRTFMAKPVTCHELIAAIDSLLSHRKDDEFDGTPLPDGA
jgi:DNA-binding response OmpR family regulator